MKRIILLLTGLFLSPLFFSGLFAQDLGKQDLTRFHGQEFSRQEGVLSKMQAFAKRQSEANTRTPLIAAAAPQSERAVLAGYGFNGNLSTGMNVPFASISDNNGNTYITGGSANSSGAQGNFVTVKVNASGNEVWEKRKVGTLYAAEFGMEIALDASGNPITTGVQWNGHDMDLHTIKYDAANGNALWEANYAGAANGLDVPKAITVDASGNVIIAGISYTGTSIRYVVVKYDPAGNLLWSVTDDNEVEEVWNEPYAIAVDASGNIAVTGYGANPDYWQSYYTIMYSSSGTALWKNTYTYEDAINPEEPEGPTGPTNSIARDVTFDADGNCYVTGTFNRFLSRIGTIKYNPAGEQQWIMTHKTDADFTDGYDIAASGNAIYVGGKHLGGWENDGMVLISYAADGTENWIQETSNLIEIKDARLTFNNTGLPVMSGFGNVVESPDSRLDVLQYSATGDVLQNASYLKPFSQTEGSLELTGIGTDTAGDIYATLLTYISSLGGVFETVKLAFGETEPLWKDIYEGNAIFGKQMLSTVRDQNDNTYVCGRYSTVSGEEAYTSYFVIKYDETGIIEWEKIFNPLNGNGADGIQLLVNTANELIVYLVPSGNLPEPQPLFLKKYSTEGNLLWEYQKMMINPAMYAFFSDKLGNIIVSGSSRENDEAMPVFATIKVSDAGTELWTEYAESGTAGDNIYAINSGLTDAEDNIILIGASGTGSMVSQQTDLTLVKYTAGGTLSWVHKLPVPNYNSVGINILLNDDGTFYVNGAGQHTDFYQEELIVMKIDASGNEVWTSLHGEDGRNVRSYTLKKLTSGDLIVVGYSVIYGVNNKVVIVKYDANGNALFVHNTELAHYFRDVYTDASDKTYLLSQVYLNSVPFRLNYSAGPFYAGSLITIANDGTVGDEELFVGPEWSTFDPVGFVPLSDDRLLIPGTLSHEAGYFGGLYFFQTEHEALGVENPGNPDINYNWLGQNYPNPAQGKATIPFYLENGGKAQIRLYDSTGKYIMDLAGGTFAAGHNSVEVDLAGLSKSIYFYQIVADGFRQSRKLIVR